MVFLLVAFALTSSDLVRSSIFWRAVTLTDMAKFTINPIALPYSGDNCYVTIGAVISQSSYSLLSWELGHLRCLVFYHITFQSGICKADNVRQNDFLD